NPGHDRLRVSVDDGQVVDPARVEVGEVEFAVNVFTKRADVDRGIQRDGVVPLAIVTLRESPDRAAAEVTIEVGAIERRGRVAAVDVATSDRAADELVVLAVGVNSHR